MRNIPNKAAGDSYVADEFNDFKSESQNAILSSNQVLSSGDLNQLAKAMAVYASSGAFYTDGGTANAYTLTAVGAKQVPPALHDGMSVIFKVGNDPTGPSTVNAAGTGIKNLYNGGGVLTGSEFAAGDIVEARYNLAEDRYDLAHVTSTSSPRLQTTTIQIGPWNMDSVSTVWVPSGMSYFNIRSVSVMVYNDLQYPATFPVEPGDSNQPAVEVGNTDILLRRLTGGVFDSINYADTGFNRGWITIWHV